MRLLILAGILAAAVSQPALADDITTSFRGIRVEGDVGVDRFRSEGISRRKLGYGGTIGLDGMIGSRVVVGAEGSYWRPDSGSENCIRGVNGGAVCSKSFKEYGTAVRVGYMVTPQILVFGKGGYVNDDSRTRFTPTTNLLYVNGVIVGPERPYYRRFSTGGYQAGGGVEYDVTSMVYANLQFIYSRYDDHTSRQRGMLGVGFRFR